MIPVPEYSGFPPLPYPFEPAGGAVPIGSPYYLERETDRRFAAALEAQESVVLIKGARQVGKTSLLARGLAQARRSGKRRRPSLLTSASRGGSDMKHRPTI